MFQMGWVKGIFTLLFFPKNSSGSSVLAAGYAVHGTPPPASIGRGLNPTGPQLLDLGQPPLGQLEECSDPLCQIEIEQIR
jgi:hypothetical protein